MHVAVAAIGAVLNAAYGKGAQLPAWAASNTTHVVEPQESKSPDRPNNI